MKSPVVKMSVRLKIDPDAAASPDNFHSLARTPGEAQAV
jgi:hypothetical protein